MPSRRDFLKLGAVTVVSVSLPSLGGCAAVHIKPDLPMKKERTGRALVVWYSQTGHTERVGRLLAATLADEGYEVTSADLRECDAEDQSGYDLIVVGSPVFYWDAPGFVRDAINSFRSMEGTAVGSYVTHGVPDGNQHNANCTMLSLLAEKGGVPVGSRSFMNMSTVPTMWTEGKVDERVWNNRRLPDKPEFEAVREYARELVRRVVKEQPVIVTREFDIHEPLTMIAPNYWTKQIIDDHGIDSARCNECGICEEKCPTNAISVADKSVDTKACVMCFGCLNNCMEQAVVMTFFGERLVGFYDFLKKYNLRIKEPPKLES